jgi:hypothetical protein
LIKLRADISSKEEDAKRILHESFDIQKEISNNEEFVQQYKMVLEELNI